jgi:hypothetical protein
MTGTGGAGPRYARVMDRRKKLLQAVADAEREFDAARRISEMNRAAKKLNRARQELQWFDEEGKPKRSTKAASGG